jgi:hypothetical protein
MSDIETLDLILFATELLIVLREIRDQIQLVADRIADMETTDDRDR